VTALLALLLAAAASPAAPAGPPRQTLDRVAATVNGDVVTLQDLLDRAGEEYRRAERMSPGPAREKARAEALQRAFDGVVADKLLEAQVAQLQVDVTDQQVDEAIENIKKANRFDDRQLDEALRDQGMDRPAFRKQVKRRLEASIVLQQKIRSRLKVSDEDVKNYYQQHAREFSGEEEIHVRHIFLPLAEGAPAADEARVRAEGEKALERVRRGEDFAKVAREVSKGPGAEEGGDLGWIRRGTIQRQLEDVAFSLQDGQVSQLVRAGPGLHLFKVEGHRVGGGKPFDSVKDQIRDLLTNEQLETYQAQYVTELKRDAVIQVNLPELKQESATASSK